MDEDHGSEVGRRKRVGDYRIGWATARGQKSGVADIDAGLPAEFGAEANGMKRRTGVGLVDKIGLVEGVIAVGPVLVSPRD